MYNSLSDLETPAGGAKVWRYMDFTKLFSMLEARALYFANFHSFGDPFEGSLTRRNQEARRQDVARQYGEDIDAKRRETFLSSYIASSGYLNEVERNGYLMNCWHLNDDESYAMWELYVRTGEGIAVQSTFDRLKKALAFTDQDIYIAKVRYIDYRREKVLPNNSSIAPVFYKRKSFEHERELRCITAVDMEQETGIRQAVHKVDNEGRVFNGEGQQINARSPFGRQVLVNLEQLIENIYVSPTSQAWFKDLVVTLLKRYDFGDLVRQSSLNDKPVF
jgi:hypothetical protein